MWNKFLLFILVLLCFSQGRADTDTNKINVSTLVKKGQRIQPEKETSIVITNKEAWTIYQKYVSGWQAISDEERRNISSEIIAANAKYSTPQHKAGGRDNMMADMAAFQQRFPGGRFDIGDVSAHHDVALMTWVLVQGDGKIIVRGHDQIRISSEGKIINLITFAPSSPIP